MVAPAAPPPGAAGTGGPRDAPGPPPSSPPDGRRRRAPLVVAAVVAVAALAAAGYFFGTDAPGPARSAGGVAPDIVLPDLRSDRTVTLAELRGKPVVLNFFASWCVPCRKELPAFQAASVRLGGQVAFLGIDHQDDREGGLRLLSETGVTYPTGYDPDGKVATSYDLFGMPTTVFISADGRILDKHTGELTESQLLATVARLFEIEP